MTGVKEEPSKGGEELMEIDVVDASNGEVRQIKENSLLLWPVLPQDGGEGLPYAPVDWPNPGDNWGWRVGKRVASSGYYVDRYLYLPTSMQKSRRKKDGFASKLSAQNYIQAKFPDKDVKAFFSSFSWKIPAKQAFLRKGELGSLRISSVEMLEDLPSDSMSGVPVCKAGNRYCSSLVKDELSLLSVTQSCDLCCSEPGFCRDCCCILCCNSIDLAFGGYSFIRCEVTSVGDGLICGHAAHVNCALRAYMGGTVGGSIGLDTEYYCRRCDSRTDLTVHVKALLKTCESIGSRDDLEKILNVGSCILRGSQKKSSQKLLQHIHSVLHKLHTEGELKDVWKAEMDVEVVPVTTGNVDNLNHKIPEICENMRHHESEILKLDDEINQVLNELRKSQDQEFSLAQERLLAQKDHLLRLYKHMEKEKTELVGPTLSTNRDELIGSFLAREEQLKHELIKLKDMEKIAHGFARTPRTMLKEHFDIDIKD